MLRLAFTLIGIVTVLMGANAPECPSDLDGSAVVDAADIGILLGGWGAAGATDLDGSGATDAADLATLLGAWGSCPTTSCQDIGWRPKFTTPGVESTVNALATFDDGTGAAVYVGGGFTEAGGLDVSKVARWDLDGWSALGGTIVGTVQCMLAHDDGSGSALYVAGTISSIDGVAVNRIARWDGATWTPLGGGVNGTVFALASYDDGTGLALYAGGSFTSAGGLPANRLAKWNGRSWEAVGGGVNDTVRALAVRARGASPGLYVGGDFTAAGAVQANRIARWSANGWSALGGGANGAVLAMQFVDGPIPSASGLVIGGCFTTAGDVPALAVARWSNDRWSALGAGLGSCVSALAVFDDGTGPALVAGGAFSGRIARWDGAAWNVPAAGGTSSQVLEFAVFDEGDGAGPGLFVGGAFDTAGGTQVRYVGRLDATGWSALGNGVSANVSDFAVFDDGRGDGPMLFATGAFLRAGGVSVNRIARWDGRRWTALGSGLNDAGYALGVFDDGGGPALFVGGRFTSAGGVPSKGIAKWDGQAWSAVGGGVAGAVPQVYALRAFSDASGSSLYVGGAFTTAGGVASQGFARWDGDAWHAIGVSAGGGVLALNVVNDVVSGAPTLCAGGAFSSVAGVAASCIAAFDGRSWRALGGGVNDTVRAIQRFDDGGGAQLYVGGEFTSAGGSAALRIARWDGLQWSPVGGGMTGIGAAVNDLAPFDDGEGPWLFAAGSFAGAGGESANRIAAWDGRAWRPIGSGIGESLDVNEYVSALQVLDDTNPDHGTLYCGGAFSSVDGAPAANVAARRCR
ncbi:MAG: hypothetical protein U0572_12650 [Phycisphaerales bacterium]